MLKQGMFLDADTLNRLFLSKTATGTQTMLGSLTLSGNLMVSDNIYAGGDFPLFFLGKATDTVDQRNYRWDVNADKLRLQALGDDLVWVRDLLELSHDGTVFKLGPDKIVTAPYILTNFDTIRSARNLTNPDFNTVVSSGIYHIMSPSINHPVALNGTLTVDAASDTNFVNQRYHAWDNKTYQRSKSGGTWTAWGEVLALYGGNLTLNGSLSIKNKFKIEYNATEDSLDFIYG